MIDLYLFDKNKEVIGIIPSRDLISYDQIQELSSIITSSFEAVYSEIAEQALYFGSKDVDDESIFWRYKIVSFSKSSDNKTFSVEGIFELFDDLKNRKIFKDIRLKGKSVDYALNMLLEGTTWEVGKIHSNNIATSNWYYETALDAFKDFIQKWRVEFKPRMIFSNGKVIAKYIDISNQISDNYGKWYEYGDKLLKVTAESNNADIATAFYIRGKGEEKFDESGQSTGGFGRRITIADIEWSKAQGNPIDKPKGQEYLEIKEATKLFGYEDGTPRFDVIILDDIDDKQELIKVGYQEAVKLSRPQRQFKATITEDEFAELGEISTIIDTRLNIRYQTRTFKIKRDFLNKKIKEIEFGDRLIKSRTEIIEDVSNRRINENSLKTDIKISNLKTELNKNQNKIIDDKLQQIRDGLIGDYWKSTAYTYNLQNGNKYNLPAGIYSFDKPIDEEPSKAIYLGAGLLMISDSKKANGDWEWATVASGSGVNADTINSGTINADFVKVTNLKAEDVSVGAEASKATLAEFLEQLNANNGDLAKRLEQSTNALSNAENKLNELEESYKQTLLSSEATEAEINNKLASLEEARAELEQAQTETKANLQEVEELAKAVTRTFNTDSLGRPVISKADSDVKLVLDNDKLSFVAQGSELAYFGKDKAYISALQILQNLNIGKYTFEAQADGGFSIKWID